MEACVPIIDVYIPDDLFPVERDADLGRHLINCLVRHEGFEDPVPEYVQRISTAYVHRLPVASIQTIAESEAKVVRIHATYHPGGLDTPRMRGFIAEATQIVSDVSGDPGLFDRTWVTLAETVEGGWGVSGKSIRDQNSKNT
jgi:hypothetical protein